MVKYLKGSIYLSIKLRNEFEYKIVDTMYIDAERIIV